MMYALLPLFLSIFFSGLIALQDTTNQNALPPTKQLLADNSGQAFLAYRNALLTYITANPTLTGTIATNLLTLPAGQTLPPGTSNNVIVTPGGGRIIYAWATLPPNTLNTLSNLQSGDPSLGLVNGTQWISPAYGIQATVVPAYVPNGSVLSILQIGN